MNVDIAVVVGMGVSRAEEAGASVGFTALLAKLQHFAHGRVAIHVCVLTLNTAWVLGERAGNGSIGPH